MDLLEGVVMQEHLRTSYYITSHTNTVKAGNKVAFSKAKVGLTSLRIF